MFYFHETWRDCSQGSWCEVSETNKRNYGKTQITTILANWGIQPQKAFKLFNN